MNKKMKGKQYIDFPKFFEIVNCESDFCESDLSGEVKQKKPKSSMWAG